MPKHSIYADNAATTRLSPEAFEAMKPYLLTDYGNPSQPYSFSRGAKNAIKEARRIIADCIGVLPSEIFFTSGGTEADNWAIKGMGAEPRRITISGIEHHAVESACRAGGEGYRAALPNGSGIITAEALSRAVGADTAVISIMLANNEIGTIQPINELATAAWINTEDAVFHTDAVQAVGHVPVDVRELGVDMLSASAHKFNGPKGVGFLYVGSEVKLKPLIDGGAQQGGMRAGTENVAGIVGMAHALKQNCLDMYKNAKKLARLEDVFLNALEDGGVDFILNGEGAPRLPGLISVSVKGADGEMLLHRLDLQGIYISTGAACDSKHTRVSRVIEAIGVPEDYAKGTIRVSFGKYNSEEDALVIAGEIIKIMRDYRGN